MPAFHVSLVQQNDQSWVAGPPTACLHFSVPLEAAQDTQAPLSSLYKIRHMSEAQLRRIERLNAHIRADLEASNIHASQACKLITQYTENTPDPFLSFAANMKNPYLKNKKRFNCNLM